MSKYKKWFYPDKVNDLIDDNGNIAGLPVKWETAIIPPNGSEEGNDDEETFLVECTPEFYAMIEETVRSQVANEIVNKNRAVRRFGRKLVKAHTNCNELVRMARKYSDPVTGSELVREELYADYSNNRKALQHELDQRRRQHDSTIWNLNRQKNNFAEFMNTYSSIYDAKTEGQMETGRSATR